jgi:hypothetical protein
VIGALGINEAYSTNLAAWEGAWSRPEVSLPPKEAFIHTFHASEKVGRCSPTLTDDMYDMCTMRQGIRLSTDKSDSQDRDYAAQRELLGHASWAPVLIGPSDLRELNDLT